MSNMEMTDPKGTWSDGGKVWNGEPMQGATICPHCHATVISTSQPELDEALGYATRLLEHFVAEHFPHNPDWKPLPDLIGVLTQLDNTITIARDYKSRLAALAATPAVGGEAINNILNDYWFWEDVGPLHKKEIIDAIAALAPPLRGREITNLMVERASSALMNTFIKKWFLGSYKGPVYLDCVNGEKSWEDEARDALTAAFSASPPEQPAADPDKETKE